MDQINHVSKCSETLLVSYGKIIQPPLETWVSVKKGTADDLGPIPLWATTGGCWKTQFQINKRGRL